MNSSHPVSRLLSELLGRRVGRHFRSHHLPPIDVPSPPLATQRDGTLVLLWSAGCSKSAPTSCLGPLRCAAFSLQIERKKRADERTRTADLISLRGIIHALQGFAEVCKSRISRRFPLLRVAECCTALRSRWCQSGVSPLRIAYPRVPHRSTTSWPHTR